MLHCLVSCNWHTVLIGEVNLGYIHLTNWSSAIPSEVTDQAISDVSVSRH